MLHLFTLSDKHTLSRTPLDEGSAREQIITSNFGRGHAVVFEIQ